jgi:hypothetical protein
MSAKNNLQEFYQKRKETLPVYTTVRQKGTPAHNPLWVSTVTLHDCRKFVGEAAAKKSVAECNAAAQALECRIIDLEPALVDKYVETPEKLADLCRESSTVIFADVENIPQILEFKFGDTSPLVTVIGVIGHCHSLSSRPFPFHKYVVRSALRDAVDHTISFLAGFVSGVIQENSLPDETDDDRPTFVILSRDHFAEATVWNLKNQSFRAIHVSNVNDVMKYLK